MDAEMVETLAATLVLGSLLEAVRDRIGPYVLVDHWKQGEFHHDVVLRLAETKGLLPGRVVVVATNCNGGVKEVLVFAEVPSRGALWHWRCPDAADFTGELPPLLARAITTHWFDPCALLAPDARSELLPHARQRQAGGGWEPATGPGEGERPLTNER
jgi:hypothetical protein